jgi:hypothetical protein
MNWVGTLVSDPRCLMFTDESAWDLRTSWRRVGWSLIGMRCVQRQCFVRGQRYSILLLLTLDGMVTWKVVEGLVTAETFVQFLHKYVVRVRLIAGCLCSWVHATGPSHASLSRPEQCPYTGQLQHPSCQRSA